MFRAPLCPSSGAQEYYTMVAACGISCCKNVKSNFVSFSTYFHISSVDSVWIREGPLLLGYGLDIWGSVSNTSKRVLGIIYIYIHMRGLEL
jgi:hypothetical protein